MGRCIGLSFRLLLVIACVAQVRLTPAVAQDVFNGGNEGGGNPNCPPPVINGITPKNSSCRTGPQYSEGNPIARPRSYSSTVSRRRLRTGHARAECPRVGAAPSGQLETHHPGPPYVPGAANPCQPGGPGSYNWLNNPVGTQLPPGCVRPPTGTTTTDAKNDPNYQPAPPGSYIVPPVGPPGSYIVPPVGPPGSYIVPPVGPPGSYVVPPVGPPGSYVVPSAGPPGSYANSTAGRR